MVKFYVNGGSMFLRVKGGTFVLVLVFASVISLIACRVQMSSVMQFRMLASAKSRKKTECNLSQKCAISLKHICESSRSFESFVYDGAQINLIQFVPDTFHFGEKEGVYYYQLDLESPQNDTVTFFQANTVAVRYPPVNHFR